MTMAARRRPARPIIVITAGPTRERLDPVRFLSNYSTGTFGYELAREAVRRGLDTVLISGPTALQVPRGALFVRVESALEMRRAVLRHLPRAAYVIMAAAVSDWRPAAPSKRKIKKGRGGITVRLAKNPDILAEIGKRRHNAVVAGFALETGGLAANVLKKLREKRADILIGNRLSGNNSVFGDNNIDIMVINRYGKRAIYRRKSKRALSKIILDKVLRFTI